MKIKNKKNEKFVNIPSTLLLTCGFVGFTISFFPASYNSLLHLVLLFFFFSIWFVSTASVGEKLHVNTTRWS